jgi:hypothetical protein
MHYLSIYTKELKITWHTNSRDLLPFKCNCKDRHGAIYDSRICSKMYMTKVSGSYASEQEDNGLSFVGYLTMLSVPKPYSTEWQDD